MKEELLRRLAEFDAGGAGVLSTYLDMRPQQSGESPGQRHALIQMRDRLREIESTLKRRNEIDALTADVERIESYLATGFPTEAQGLAVFACAPAGLFETVTSGTPFDTRIAYGPRPELYQLAKLIDDLETAVVAVVDTNTARLFVMRTGFLKEVGGPDRSDHGEFHKHKVGGWSQARFQRHIQHNRLAFMKEAGEAIEALVRREGATRLIVAGNEVAVPLLKDALSPQVKELLHDEALRLHIRAGEQEVQSEVAPILAQLEAEQDHTVAELLAEGVRGGGLAVSGMKHTRRALENGQVDTLVLAADHDIPQEQRNELIQLAAITSAAVEVVEGHETLRQLGGVGALLRYQL
ncbi:MAG TPA: Vms1/Ankzf1 family peptidyl-tRNA hydrolase [Roseiflexaceae bacterium]|nr:Vms1/Ankzf1 family peptidyl-tRNA hydrolase [Roseiflexaceae bacterium]